MYQAAGRESKRNEYSDGIRLSVHPSLRVGSRPRLEPCSWPRRHSGGERKRDALEAPSDLPGRRRNARLAPK